MIEIRNKHGNVIGTSKNQAGVRKHSAKVKAKAVSVNNLHTVKGFDGEAKLCILFEDGSSCEFTWGSLAVLKLKLRNWLNLYGANLVIDGVRSGKLLPDNPWFAAKA